MSDSETLEGNTIEDEEEEEFIGFDDDEPQAGESAPSDEDLYEDCIKDKYKDIVYTKADRINLIKKIEMYLSDPELRKIVMKKIHLAPYIDLGSMKKKKDFNNLDGQTLNWIYDEIRDSSMNSLMTDVAFNGYIGINNFIESMAVGSGYVPELEGYSEKLDNPMNRTLVKQITIDNFNYFSGSLSPQYLLMFNTINCMSATYKVNKRKKKAEADAKRKQEEENNKPNPVESQPVESKPIEPSKEEQPIKLEPNPVADRVKSVFGNNTLPGFSS